MNRYTISLIFYSIIQAIFVFVATGQNKSNDETGLIPNILNPSPDYYCTWQTQQYYTNAGGSGAQRANMVEANMFGKEAYQSWTDFYPNARADLYFVMDDSWDISLTGDQACYFGSLILNGERFPSYAKAGISNQDALKNLSTALKTKGWKGLGGWVCAQEAPGFINGTTPQDYWTERAKWANYSGFTYWKVDWGKKIYDYKFRKMLTDIAHQYAPNLTVENAQNDSVIPVSDVFRTYDVPAILSIPMTMKKLKNSLPFIPENVYKGLICAEDEVYIAAALGCTMGVMRHPMAGNLPNGKPDPSFPEIHRNIKTKIDEVTRAVRWHRIAPAFAVNAAETYIDSVKLTDSWNIENMSSEIESWWFESWTGFKKIGNVISESGSARISRGIALPLVKPDENGDVPFVVAAKNPNGVVSVATLGRTVKRKYWTPLSDVTIQSGKATTFGIFGTYRNLILDTDLNLRKVVIKAQDLAGVQVKDITSEVKISKNKLTIPGSLITKTGTGEQTKRDTSDPGLILVITEVN